MEKLVVGILAHVDAGKTTLSEGMLYLSGKINNLGRVDNKDAYLDTHQLERERGITIFSQQAVFSIAQTEITLLDTPGHVDFSAEMERTLQVLDCAILVISGADGIQGHTRTLWHLLNLNQVPVFIFINKMDQPGTDKKKLLTELKEHLSEACIEFSGDRSESFMEQLALCDESLMESYLETGSINPKQIRKVIKERKLFPCFFGSALKLDGVELFMENLSKYAPIPSYPSQFGARIYKISRDDQGNRLTHLKLTGGTLKVKDSLTNGDWEAKVNQIRIYSGQSFRAVNQIKAGQIGAVTGLDLSKPGEGLGSEESNWTPLLEPVLSYRVGLPTDLDTQIMLRKLHQIEEEVPELRIVWDEELEEIQAQIMGEVQIEILQSLIKDRFDVEVVFETGKIHYKETVANTVEGVGHFEPLGHYGEVQLLIEPGKQGSGLKFLVDCSEDQLAKNWQRLILTHLKEKVHKGVLTGSPITDLQITVVGGRAHNNHTTGGDFREATYRALRQGLKEAESILLEPYYEFRLEVPEKVVGKAMTDIDKMSGTWEIAEVNQSSTVLVGTAPVVNMRNYHREVIAYTKGEGRLFCNLAGYKPCQNASEIIAQIGYDSEKDEANPTGSIFISRGAGFFVKWDKVKDFMHGEAYLKPERKADQKTLVVRKSAPNFDPDFDNDYRYLNTTANYGKKRSWSQKRKERENELENKIVSNESLEEPRENYLLVDGYNIIHAWLDLKELVDDNMDGARIKLLDALSSYQAISKYKIIVVFDAHLVPGRDSEEIIDYHNIHVVFTKHAQTADQYIEKFAHDHRKKYNIVVATSDGLQQVIIRVAGSVAISASDLKEEIERVKISTKLSYESRQPKTRTSLDEVVSPKLQEEIKKLQRNWE